MLKIYDTNHNAIGHIVKYKDLKVASDVTTGDQTLSFTYMARHHEICEEYYIETQDAEYVVKEKSVSTDGFLSFVAVLNLEELEAKPWSSFGITDSTIEDAAKLALAGSGWTVGECTVTKKRNAGILQTNTLGVIQKLCTAFMCEVVYDTKKKTVSFYDQVGQDKGNFFLTGLNLKRLQRKGSTYDYYTRIIPIGQDGLTIESVNDGKNYLENYQYTNKVKTYIWKDESYTDAAAMKEDAEARLKDLSKPEVSYSADIIDLAKQRAGYDDFSFSLGDTITLIDAATGIREKQRIIKLTQYPQDHTKDECELANKLPSFEEAREKLQAAQEIINTVISDDGRYTGTINVSDILHFDEGVYGSSAVGNLQGLYNTLDGSLSELKLAVGQIESNYIKTEEADIKFATIESLKALEAETTSIKSKYAEFESTVTDELAANKALINELDVKKINAADADLKYASIDFSNIGIAAMKKFYSESGLIKNVVVGDQTITGELVGVTIKGDLIEGNTIKADKLVIKGEDGLYYKLNTNGSGVTSEQTDYNSLNGTVIQAKSITADKVAVTDLVAFGADIGGNHIGHDCIYSGAKTSALNTTRGFYLGSDGQVGFGDTNEYIQFYKGDDGNFHLRISAGDILFGKSKKTVESAITEIDTKVNNVKSIVGNTYTYQVGTISDTQWSTWNDAYTLANSVDMGIAAWCYNNDRTYINGGRLYAGSVTAVQMAANSITTEKIAAGSVTADKIDVVSLFAKDIEASGSISGVKIVAREITANQSYSIFNGTNSQKILYFDGSSIKLGKMGTGTSIQGGAGFEFFDKTVTMYGDLSLYSGDITTPGNVQGKTITATADMNTNTIYASNWFRSRGTTGWYSEDYGGGWYMTDSDWIRAYNGKGITTNGNMSIGGYIQSNNIINTTYEYQSNRGSVDWRFGAATGTGDENFFSFYKANNGMIPLAIDGNFGNIYVGFNVGGSGSKTAVGVYLGAEVAGSRAFIYHGDSYAGSIWIQTRLDGSWKWFSLGRACSAALSDIRLKDDIRDTEVQDATKVIEAMQIRSFERKDSHKKYKIGFIADELEQLDPNLVDGGGEVDGHPYYKSVNNLQLLAYVVKAMQELSSKVDRLERENEELRRKLYS